MKQPAFLNGSFLLLFLGLILCDSAAADFREPTDVELKASYCIGVVKEQLHELQGKQGKDWNEVRKENVDVLKRLQAYLLPRITHIEPAGMMAARARGLRDMKESTRRSKIMADRTLACAMSECGNKDEADVDSCLKNCQADPFIKCQQSLEGPAEERFEKCANTDPFYSRFRACYKLEWLPF